MRLRLWLVFFVGVAVLAGCASVRRPVTVTPTPDPTRVAPSPTAGDASSATPDAPITLTYWEEDVDAAGVILDELAAGFMAANPHITVQRIHYTYEDLRTQFREIGRGYAPGEPPDLVRGPGEYAGPFSELGIIQPLDEFFAADFLDQYLPGALDGVTVRGRVWGLPDSWGNHVMLFYNRALVSSVPVDTGAWIEQMKGLTDAANGQYGLAFAADESYWLIPWLAGFGGWPLDVGDRPALDTAEMIEALWFVYDLKFTDKILPETSDYDAAFRLFSEGKAAYVIDGRWNLEVYQGLGIDVGIASLPRVTRTGIAPAPMATGSYWYLAQSLDPAKLDAAARFVEYMTSAAAQDEWLLKLGRLPSSRETANGPLVAADFTLSAVVAQLEVARGVPPALEMACAWRGIDSQLSEVIVGNLNPDQAAPLMQEVADRCMAEIALDPTPTPTPEDAGG